MGEQRGARAAQAEGLVKTPSKSPAEAENFCMEADHYTKCPRFLVDCDAVNCKAKGYTWQEVEARRKVLANVGTCHKIRRSLRGDR